MAGWVSQSFFTSPAMTACIEVGGKWWANSRNLVGPSFNFQGSRDLVEINLDGSFTNWAMPANGSQGEPAWRSMVAFGNKIYIPIFSSNTFAEVRVFDTVAHTWTLLSLNTSGSFPGFGQGCVAPDGKIYFPPFGGPSTLVPLVVDPVAGTMAFTTFGGSWPGGGKDIGHFCMGGDGNMYYLPGQVSPWASGYLGDTIWGYISGWPSSPTHNSLGPTLPRDHGPYNDAAVWIWAMPAPDGIYAQTWGGNFYKITTAGAQFLSSSNPYEPAPYNQPELTDQSDFWGNAVVGPDGLIYTVGSGYIGSSNWPPVVATINPANDEVHFHEYYDFPGHPFVGAASYIFDGKLRTFASKVVSSSIVDIWENEFYGTPGWSFAVGSTPVSLAVGASARTGRVG